MTTAARVLCVPIVLVALVGVGCQQKSAEPAMGGRAVEPSASSGGVKVVNAWCPVMDEHPVGSGSTAFIARADSVRDYKGMKVGFCCEDCPSQWDAMPEAEKAAALAKARSTPPAK